MEFPYKQYFDSMPCYLTIQDRDLKVILANKKFEEDFGNYRGRYCYQVYKAEEPNIRCLCGFVGVMLGECWCQFV